MSQHLDPRHAETRAKLRRIGPIVAGIGLVFTLIGLINFFSSFGEFTGPPRFFWCAFVGLPLLGVGLMICKFAYLGTLTRYVGNEVAPVGKDMANYMAEGTKGAVRTVAAAIGEGLRAGDTKACPKCNAANRADAGYCDKCGQSLAGPVG